MLFFSRKKSDTSHPILYFNNIQIQRQYIQKHLGLSLDEKLSFLEYTDVKIKKATVGRKLNLLLLHSSLLTVYKCFTRPHLNYGDLIYDQQNLSFSAIRSNQFNTKAFTCAIKATLKEKFYLKLSFESLKDRICLRRLCYQYRTINTTQSVI